MERNSLFYYRNLDKAWYEEWKEIEDDPRYEVSNYGRFRKKNKVNGYRYLKPYKKCNLFVIKVNGKPKNCARLVANYHIRKLTKNDCVYHKNKLSFDNFVYNLEIVNKKDIGKLTGHIATSKRVVQVKNGEIIRSWRSARRCAKDLFISRQTATDYCNGKVNRPVYCLMWEDDYFKKIGF